MLYCTQAVASWKVSGPYEVSHITSNNSDFYKKKYVIVFKGYLFSIFLFSYTSCNTILFGITKGNKMLGKKQLWVSRSGEKIHFPDDILWSFIKQAEIKKQQNAASLFCPCCGLLQDVCRHAWRLISKETQAVTVWSKPAVTKLSTTSQLLPVHSVSSSAEQETGLNLSVSSTCCCSHEV